MKRGIHVEVIQPGFRLQLHTHMIKLETPEDVEKYKREIYKRPSIYHPALEDQRWENILKTLPVYINQHGGYFVPTEYSREIDPEKFDSQVDSFALKKAVEFIADKTGSCPLDAAETKEEEAEALALLECSSEKCDGRRPAECWLEWFKGKARKIIQEG